MIDKVKLSRRFSKGAKDYDKYARVQKTMGDSLVSKAKDDGVKHILEIGCGTGYVTKKLIEKYPDAEIDAVDIAMGMIQHASSSISDDRVNFICGDVEEMQLTKKYDLIISNATFQWFNDLKGTLKKLDSYLDDGGFILFSTFGVNTFTELKECFIKASDELCIDTILPSQKFMSPDDIKDVASGEMNIYESMEIEHFNNCNEFFTSVKKIGANNSSKNRIKATPSFMKKVVSIYDNVFREDDRVKATYHTVIVKIDKSHN